MPDKTKSTIALARTGAGLATAFAVGAVAALTWSSGHPDTAFSGDELSQPALDAPVSHNEEARADAPRPGPSQTRTIHPITETAGAIPPTRLVDPADAAFPVRVACPAPALEGPPPPSASLVPLAHFGGADPFSYHSPVCWTRTLPTGGGTAGLSDRTPSAGAIVTEYRR